MAQIEPRLLVAPDLVDFGPNRHVATVAGVIAQRRAIVDDALAALQGQAATVARAAAWLVDTLRAGGMVLVAGNGGSAAEAQHFATELVGRFKRERAPYPVLALPADATTLTAVANDYGFAEVFARQVCAYGRPGDLLIAFSTSGESENLVRAAEAARSRGLRTLAVTGPRPSRLEDRSDLTVRVPVADMPAVQELHMILTHLLCDIAETDLAAGDGRLAP